MNWQLKKIITKDGIELDGLFFYPQRSKRRALLYIHGFPGNFYSNLGFLNNIAERCNKHGFALASFNMRGHDIISYSRQVKGRRKKIKILGSAFENFEDCILDINAGIKFLKSQGFNQIILVGRSGGTDKVGYYLSRTHSGSVIGAIFISPGDNILIAREEFKKSFKPLLEKAGKMISSGKGKELMLVGKADFPISWERFISLYQKESSENVFSFHDLKSGSKVLSKIKEPILVVLGSKDEHLHSYDPESVISIFREKAKETKSFSYVIIKGGDHSLEGKEKRLVNHIVNWVKKI